MQTNGSRAQQVKEMGEVAKNYSMEINMKNLY